MLTRPQLIASWTCQVIAAAILFQTLFFKFSGSEESRFIFTALGVEPWGRWLAGLAELAAVVLLLLPSTAAFGAALALAVISGAILAHLTRLGIVVHDDGGLLFALAIAVLVASSAVLAIRRRQLPLIGPRLAAPVPAHPVP